MAQHIMREESPAGPPVSIERISCCTDEVRELIEELDRELAVHYSAEQRHGLSLDAIVQPPMRFFIARSGGAAAGCGGVALFAEFGEVKRMYVRPAARGRGVADAILAALTNEAIGAGLPVLRLETGVHQRAAIRFYERAGFGPCSAFEPYASMQPHEVETSVFLEKRIGAAG